MAKFAVVIYSTYGHIVSLAESIVKGIESTGSSADLFQVPETLPEEILTLIHAPPKNASIPVISSPDALVDYDGILFGFPTRFGNAPAQMSAFFDSTGGLWATGKLYQKPAGIFVSTGTGGGNEVTIRNSLSFLTHHGMIYVPLGGAAAFAELTDLTEVHGGSAWGAAGIAGADGSRQFSKLELKIAFIQGAEFSKVGAKLAAVSAPAAVAHKTKKAVTKKTETTEVKTSSPPASASATPTAEKSGCCIIM